MKEIFERLLTALRTGENAVLCSILAVSGSTPRGAGAKMTVFADGSFTGTIGGGTVEFAALQRALEALRQGHSGFGRFQLRHDGLTPDMACGGEVSVYFQLFQAADPAHIQLAEAALELACQPVDSWLITEAGTDGWNGGAYDGEHGLRFLPETELPVLQPMMTRRAVWSEGERRYLVEPLGRSECLYVFGGGHVSQALVPVLTTVGFRVVVLENRPEFAVRSLFPTADQVILAPFSTLVDRFSVAERDGIIIMTRGHQDDDAVLRQALATGAGYVGVIGSRRKAALTMERLRRDGVSEADLQRIHSPIGLPIGAETPEEIAVSVAAELIAYRAASSAVDGR